MKTYDVARGEGLHVLVIHEWETPDNSRMGTMVLISTVSLEAVPHQ